MKALIVPAALTLLVLTSCTVLKPAVNAGAGSSMAVSAGSEKQAGLAASARSLIGRRMILVKGRWFNPDCTGAVLGIYWASGIDLMPVFNRYRGNGVSRLFQALLEAGLLHSRTDPEPGDLVFWDDTYDRNGNGAWDDTLTHVGMVIETDTMGNVTYVHYHYSKGVVAAKMNLVRPNTWRQDDVLVNSPLRMKGAGTPDSARWLSGQLFHAFGQAYLLR